MCVVRLLLILGAISLAGCAVLPKGSSEIGSQVVDADTGAPIAGVMVVGYWELSKGSLTGDGLPCGSAHVEEAVSGDDGRFKLPGWVGYGHCLGSMSDGPRLFLFKSGYGYATYTNGYSTGPTVWTGSTLDKWQIKMKAFEHPDLFSIAKGSYLDGFNQLNQDLMWFVVNMPSECNWKKIPNMLRTIATEELRLSELPSRRITTVSDTLRLQDEYFQKKAPGCGSPKAFIENLTKQETQPPTSAAVH